jgi:hypothetical protein
MKTASLPDLTLTLDSIRLSDLFFNHEKQNYDNCMGSDEELEKALLEDAADFTLMLTGKRDPELAAQLVEDFNERL